MTKRFQYIREKYKHSIHDTVKDGEYKKGYRTTYDEFDLDKLTDELNIRENKIKQLENENKQLKQELGIYRKVASCSNCKYHNYNWYDDGDEFEVCDKGNDVTDGICEDWEEL